MISRYTCCQMSTSMLSLNFLQDLQHSQKEYKKYPVHYLNLNLVYSIYISLLLKYTVFIR